MEKPISRQQHGFTDYSYIPLVAAAPALANFKDQPTATLLTRVLSGSILATSLMTRAEWGAFRILPFKAHLAADAAVGTMTLAAPWLFGFAGHHRARNAFLAIGAFGLMAGLLSRPDEMK
ncbi:hypothetical protein ACFQ4C_05585 [Larkinella insperata]|uniref:SPW repeat-containing integral membrane domain-containing protein n=1 Tax=Larkinella insperata TaxID=332158 RepID=A0ABW3Q9G3_9BACT|nr:hypothetical protein [Larkinella insperata]